MRSNEKIGLDDVKAVYSGPEGALWELVMGEQIHIGGFSSSMDLAQRAGIAPGTSGVDLCCCNGAGMRFLVRFREVARMTGVDATAKVVADGRDRVRAEGLADRIELVQADAVDTGLPDGSADFVWGEDAWCYVADKAALVGEAARLAAPGGTVAFTDWVEGPEGLAGPEADRLLAFMKFPSLATIDDYRDLLADRGLTVAVAEDTGRFAPYADLYLGMVERQLTFDALKILGWDTDLLGEVGEEMGFLRDLAQAGKVAQAIFVANKP